MSIIPKISEVVVAIENREENLGEYFIIFSNGWWKLFSPNRDRKIFAIHHEEYFGSSRLKELETALELEHTVSKPCYDDQVLGEYFDSEILNPEKFWGNLLENQQVNNNKLIEIKFSDQDIKDLQQAYSFQNLRIIERIANKHNVSIFDIVSVVSIIRDSLEEDYQYYRIGLIGKDVLIFSIDKSGEVCVSIGGNVSRKYLESGVRVIRLCIQWWKDFLKFCESESEEIYCYVYDVDGLGHKRKSLYQRLGFIQEEDSRKYVYR